MPDIKLNPLSLFVTNGSITEEPTLDALLEAHSLQLVMTTMRHSMNMVRRLNISQNKLDFILKTRNFFVLITVYSLNI